jgi:hypothetical protein
MNKLLLPALSLLLTTTLSAQQAITSAGGSAANANLACTFVFGQMIAPDTEKSDRVLYPAVIFPAGSFTTGIPEISQNNWRCYVSNSHVLHIVRQGEMPGGTSCEIYNMQGAVYFKGKIRTQELDVSLVNYPAGVYILAIREKNQKTETIKFIKR